MSDGEQRVFEHERRAFLTEAQHDHAAHALAELGDDLGQDDKASSFFVLDNLNLSVAVTAHDARIKLKQGTVGTDTSAVELPEVVLADRDKSEDAIRMLGILTGVTPQRSYQVRHNYKVGDVEVALKYTEAWGFHAEFECLYGGETEQQLARAAKRSDQKIYRLAGRLGIQLATDQDLQEFRRQYDTTGEGRGPYRTEDMLALYGTMHKLAATRRLPEQQVLDTDSLDWLVNHRPDSLPAPTELQLSPTERALLANLDLPADWFVSPARKETVHGQLHLARVAALAAHVAREQGADERTARTAFLAGLLHDLRRRTDKADAGHAKASADWVAAHWPEVRAFVGDLADDVSPLAVRRAVSGHEYPRRVKQPASRQLVEYIRTADGLDRYRFPKQNWWVNDSYLTIQPSPDLKARAFELVVTTEGERNRCHDLAAATRRIVA